MADWDKIRTDYITTNTSYRKLADKYGVYYTNISKKGKAEGWQQMRQQFANKTAAKTLNAIGKQQVSRAARLQTVADKLLGKVEALVEASDPTDMDTQALRHISATLKDIKDIQMVRSDADMREQEARIAKLRREAESETGDKQITIEIAGGDGSWSR